MKDFGEEIVTTNKEFKEKFTKMLDDLNKEIGKCIKNAPDKLKSVVDEVMDKSCSKNKTDCFFNSKPREYPQVILADNSLKNFTL